MEESVEESEEVLEEESAWAHLKARELEVVKEVELEVEWVDTNIEKRLLLTDMHE